MTGLTDRTLELSGARLAARYVPGDDAHGRALVVVAESSDGLDALLAPSLTLGLCVLVPDLGPAAGGAAFADWRDRDALALLEHCAAWLVAEGASADSIALLGVGAAAPLAWLGGCLSTKFAVVASLGAVPVYDGLSAAKPMQPVEMTLNLDRALLAAFAEDAAHLDLVREQLDSGAKDYEWLAADANRATELARFLEERL